LLSAAANLKPTGHILFHEFSGFGALKAHFYSGVGLGDGRLKVVGEHFDNPVCSAVPHRQLMRGQVNGVVRRGTPNEAAEKEGEGTEHAVQT
jgi:hypothetical protein